MKASRFTTRVLVAGAVAALLPVTAALAQSAPQAPPEDSSSASSQSQSSQSQSSPAQNPPAETSPDASSSSRSTQQGASFDALDTDHDGRISRAEAAVNPNVNDQFSRYDQNGDGYIDKSEVSSANHPSGNPGQ